MTQIFNQYLDPRDRLAAAIKAIRAGELRPTPNGASKWDDLYLGHAVLRVPKLVDVDELVDLATDALTPRAGEADFLPEEELAEETPAPDPDAAQTPASEPAPEPNFAAAVREAIKVYTKTGRMLDPVLIYAKHGIPIFPCDPVTKVPIPRRDGDPTGKFKQGIPGTGGFKKATTDPIVITGWWTRNPKALIAVPMGPRSGVWCVDVDTALEHEDESVTAWNALTVEHEPFTTREHRSASGGPHVLFKWNDERPLGCSAGSLPKGISIKGDGGYIVVPPSVRKKGSYTVFRDIDPIDAPQWLVDAITEGKPTPESKQHPRSPQQGTPQQGTPQCDLDELADAMRFVPNNSPHWEVWASWGLAIFAASGGSQRGLEIFDEWSRKWPGYDAGKTDYRWEQMSGSPPNRTGAEKIFAEARRHGRQPKLKAAPPTYPIATATPDEGRDKMREVVRDFLRAVDLPNLWQNFSNIPPPPFAHAARIDVGGGKTQITIEELARWLKNGTRVIYATPRHKLNERIEQQFAAHGITARIYRGRGADDPLQPKQIMCLFRTATQLAESCHAEVGPTCCKNKKHICQFYGYCGFQRQLRDRDGVQVWIVAIDTLFRTQKALGEPRAVIIDEALWQKGIRGVEANEEFDYSVAIDSISSANPPPKTPENINSYGLPELDFLHLRHKLASALRAHAQNGAVERKLFDELFLEGTNCTHALNLEWARYNADLEKLGQHPGMSEQQVLDLANNRDLVDRIQHARRLIKIWGAVRELLNSTDINRSGRLTLTQHNGQRTITWRGIDSIKAQFTKPTLLLDATMPQPSMLEPYHPRVQVVADIKIALPKAVHIRQVLGTPTSARKLIDIRRPNVRNPERHLIEIRRHILARYLELARPATLVICQEKVEDWLRQRGLPDNITIEHYNDITGLDIYRNVRLLILIGRTAPGPQAAEILAAALTGKTPVPINGENNGFRWYDQVERGIRLRDGSGIATTGDQHPDPDVEAVRYQIHEAELVQALGRARAIHRTDANPLDADLLFDTCLPITVDEVIRWTPPSLLTDTALNDGVMLTAPCDLVKLWPALWSNEKAAYRTVSAGVPKLPGFHEIEYQPQGPKMNKRVGYFDPAIIANPIAQTVRCVLEIRCAATEIKFPAPKILPPRAVTEPKKWGCQL